MRTKPLRSNLMNHKQIESNSNIATSSFDDCINNSCCNMIASRANVNDMLVLDYLYIVISDDYL